MRRRHDGDDSRLVRTQRGAVELTRRGRGPTVLALHGDHGDCFEDLGIRELADAGFEVVLPSRPGYGRTPLGAGPTATASSDLLAQLLDAVDLDTVTVLARSTAGPTALQLAMRHHGRIRRMVLVSAVTQPWLDQLDAPSAAARLLFHPRRERVTWAALRMAVGLAPHSVTRAMRRLMSTRPEGPITSEQVALVRRLLLGQASGAGFLADVRHRVAPATVAAVRVPTLLLHSGNDRAIPLDHALHAHDLLPDSRLVVLDNAWGHLVWADRMETVTRRTAAFLGDGHAG